MINLIEKRRKEKRVERQRLEEKRREWTGKGRCRDDKSWEDGEGERERERKE